MDSDILRRIIIAYIVVAYATILSLNKGEPANMRFSRFARKVTLTSMAVLSLLLVASVIGTPAALASGNPPSIVVTKSPLAKSPKLDVGATDTAPSRSHNGRIQFVQAPPPPGGSGIYQADPIIMVGGLKTSSGYSDGCSGGYWGIPLQYLQSNGQAVWHPGIGSAWIAQTGTLYTVGYYNSNYNCSVYLSTTDSRGLPAGKCNGLVIADGSTISNSDGRIGNQDEPIEHISCELSWFVYNIFSQYGINVKMVGHSMGGLIIRYMIQKAGHDSHFAPYVDVSDVVTFSAPMAGLTVAQATGVDFACACYEVDEMTNAGSGVEAPFMAAISSNSHPNAAKGTDWTLIGSLSNNDPLDWDYQATALSNTSAGAADNHRIGYSNVPNCSGQPSHSGWYGHGDYLIDPCDGSDASYYYCDGCSESQHTNFSLASADAPHSLREMLFAFTYWDW